MATKKQAKSAPKQAQSAPRGTAKRKRSRKKAVARREKLTPVRAAARREKPSPVRAAAKEERPAPARKATTHAAPPGAISRVTETLATALGGVTGATLELSSTALSAVGTSVRAAQQIGGEVVKATAAAAAESLGAAQRAWRSAKAPQRSAGRASGPRAPGR